MLRHGKPYHATAKVKLQSWDISQAAKCKFLTLVYGFPSSVVVWLDQGARFLLLVGFLPMPHHLGILHGTLKTSIASASKVERKAFQLEEKYENSGTSLLGDGKFTLDEYERNIAIQLLLCYQKKDFIPVR